MMQFFKKVGNFLFSRLGKNQPLQIQELDQSEPDLPAEDVSFDLAEEEVKEVYSDCDCECGNDMCKNTGLEVLPNDPAQDEPQKEEALEISPATTVETSPVVEGPKKIEKKPKGRPKKHPKKVQKKNQRRRKLPQGQRKTIIKRKRRRRTQNNFQLKNKLKGILLILFFMKQKLGVVYK